MGTRASFRVLPKSVAKRIYNADEETIISTLYSCEKIIYDFCTDSFFDVYQKMPRVSRKRLSSDCDSIYRRMRRDDWIKFTEVIHKDARKQATNGMDADFWDINLRDIDEITGYRLTNGVDWVSAYFQAVHILRIFDWKNNFILAICG